MTERTRAEMKTTATGLIDKTGSGGTSGADLEAIAHDLADSAVFPEDLGDLGGGDMAAATYDAAGIAQQVVGTTATQTLTNKTLTQPTLTFKQGTGATTEGAAEWDATANVLKIGTGSASHTFLASAHFSGDVTVSTAGVVTFSGNSVDIEHLSATGTPSATTYLRGDNSWATIAAAGDVTKVGTPVAGRMAYWTGDGTLGHEAGFEYDPATDTLTVARMIIGGATLDGTTLADPGGDRLLGWDDGLGTTAYFEIGDGLDLTDGVLSATGGSAGDMAAATYDAAGIAEQLVGLTATQTLTNKTMSGPILADTGASPTVDGQERWNATTNFREVGNGSTTHYFPATAHFSGDATVSTSGVVTIAAGFYKSGGTDVAIADGGTGASTALGAVNNLSAGMASVSLTDATTITPDFSAGRNFHVTLGGNRTLANPTNQVAGQGGRILVTQDGTGSRTLSYGANWKFFGSATLSTTAGAIDMILYDVHASGTIYASLIKNAVTP